MAKEKNITIVWRDENYGRINDAFAFRSHCEPCQSDTENKKVARLYKKMGFEVNQTRASWIAEYAAADTPLKLVAALEEMGYTVKNAGAAPSILAQPAEAMKA